MSCYIDIVFDDMASCSFEFSSSGLCLLNSTFGVTIPNSLFLFLLMCFLLLIVIYILF